MCIGRVHKGGRLEDMWRVLSVRHMRRDLILRDDRSVEFLTLRRMLQILPICSAPW